MIEYPEHLRIFEEMALKACGHRVRIKFKDGRYDYVGYCLGYTPFFDNYPDEISQIDVQPTAHCGWFESFCAEEVEDIIVLD